MNGESLLGARHKHAVNVMKSLHDFTLVLVCDGYNNARVPQSAPAKVNQGHDLQGQSCEVITGRVNRSGGPAFQGYERSSYNVSQGQGLVSQGHKVITRKASEGHGLAVQDHDVAPDRVGQGREPVLQGHEVSSDISSQGQGLVFQGVENVDVLSEPITDEQRRERARQRRLARYSSSVF